jgi:hypothetical protein
MATKASEQLNDARVKIKEVENVSNEHVASHGPTTLVTKDATKEGKDGGEDDGEQDVDIVPIQSNVSIVKRFSLSHEILFVGVICLSQFLTRE